MTTMATSLSVPAVDDTMEISSDAGRADHDIDIDFMGSEHGDIDVDWMLQDAASERGEHQAQAQNDDPMYDDGDEITYVEEDTMQEDAPAGTETYETADLEIDFDAHPATEETLYDITQAEPEQTYAQHEEETLIDFETLSEQGDEQIQDDLQIPAQHVEESTVVAEDVKDKFAKTQADDAAEQTEIHTDAADATWEFEAQAADLEHATGTHEEHQALADVPGEEEFDTADPSEVPTAGDISRHASPTPELSSKPADLLSQSSDGLPQHKDLTQPEVNQVSASSASSTFARASVHPITIYQVDSKAEYFLFANSGDDDPNTYLLKDRSVASSTLKDLFRACRSVLDQEVSADVEIELYIDSFNMSISEDSSYCRDTSLAQIVDVYVELSRNSGIQDIPPLYIELHMKKRFAVQLTTLFQCVSEKKGLHEIPGNEGETQQEVGELFEHETEQEVEQAIAAPENEGSYEENVDEHVPVEDSVHHENVADAAEVTQDVFVQTEEENTLETELQHEATQQTEAQIQDSYYEEATEHQEDNQEEKVNHEEQAQVDEDVAGGLEQGDGGSSGSSTVQGENQLASSNNDTESSLEGAQAHDQNAATEEKSQVDQAATNDFATEHGEQGPEESYDLDEEQLAESYDETTFETDTFNQEFDATADYTGDLEYHEDTQEGEQHDHIQAEQDWTYDEAEEHELHTTQAGTGTFKVPSSTGAEEEDEDEITFNDDEFDLDDGQTLDAAAQVQTTGSPLGKRSREDDGDGEVNGSDQESKRLKAV